MTGLSLTAGTVKTDDSHSWAILRACTIKSTSCWLPGVTPPPPSEGEDDDDDAAVVATLGVAQVGNPGIALARVLSMARKSM